MSELMQGWPELIRTALLGTGRGSAAAGDALLLGLPPAVRDHLPTGQEADGGHRLLASAGLQELYEIASALPPSEPPDPTWRPAPKDSRPPCPPAALPFLERMLNGHHQHCLPEFLKLLGRNGQRVPAQLLPNLLQHGTRYPPQQPAIRALLGPRGRWLAGFVDKWSFATTTLEPWEALVARWPALSLKERTRLLNRVRGIDPAAGRALLETFWKREKDNTRLHLLRTLEQGLSLADEPFLEAALDDRHQQIRQQAVKLLATLPDSQLAHRLSGYLAGIVHWSPASKQKITITFPPEPTPAMVRDGIAQRQQMGLSHYITRQLTFMIGAAPLRFWSDHWGKTPEQILAAVQRSGWTRTLVTGFAQAAERQRDPLWGRALLVQDDFSMRTQKLIDLLPAAEGEQLVMQVMDRWQGEPFDRKNPLRGLWRAWDRPWSAAASRRWVAIMAEKIDQDEDTQSPDVSLRSLFLRFMRQCPPSAELAAEIAATLEAAIPDQSAWHLVVTEALAELDFRVGMVRSLQADNFSSRAK